MDECLYSKHSENEICYIVFHVDDFLFAASSLDVIEDAVKQMRIHFEIEDIGKVDKFLGVDIIQLNDGTYAIHQATYISRMIEELNLSE